jgi:DNA-binding response OmpR family regulator
MPQQDHAAILLIEDNPLTLQVLIEHLKKMGHRTTVARSGEEALRQIGMQKPDLILLDIMLPGMDGYETCRRLKRNMTTKDIPVIVLTVLSNTEEKVKAYEAGAVDFLTKPIDFKEVAARIQTRLTLQRLQRRLKTRASVISSDGKVAANGVSPNILIVEDNPMTLQLLLKYLAGMGFESTGVQTGEEALNIVRQTVPDLILLDVMLPGIDGFETCRRLKSSAVTREIPIIFMTALSETHDKVKAFESGAVDYITKPHHYAEVAARINTHLTLQTLQRQLKSASS